MYLDGSGMLLVIKNANTQIWGQKVSNSGNYYYSGLPPGKKKNVGSFFKPEAVC